MPLALQHFDATSFTLAVTSEQLILRRVQDAVRDILATGKNVRATPQTISEILKAAGGSRSDPSYGELIQRTNMMNAYQAAADAARQTPEALAAFPVWRWDAIADGRCRPSHLARDGKYYPATVTLPQVRDVNGFDGFNERCVSTPIYWKEWERLKASGARVADGYSEPVVIAPQRLPVALPPEAQAMLPPEFGQARALPDLMRTPEGREWALANKAQLRAALLGVPIKATAALPPVLPSTLPIPEPKPASLPTATTLPGGQRVEFVLPEISPKAERTVWADVRKLDSAWENSDDYLTPGMGGTIETGLPLPAPRVALDPQGRLYFIDGRHDYAALRDRGLVRILVMVRASQAARMEGLFS